MLGTGSYLSCLYYGKYGLLSPNLDSMPRRTHEIASEYHITWPPRCLLYSTFKNESNLDLQDQDHTKV